MNRIEAGQIQKDVFGMEQQNAPSVLRNTRGQIVWQLRGNTLEQNEQLGINNIQGLFLQTYPDFNELFPRGKDGKIAEDKRKEAKKFILDKIGTQRKLTACSGSSPLTPRKVPYFGSPEVTIRKSFSSWGIQFEDPHQEVQLVGETSSQTTLIAALSQQKGVNGLKSYFDGIKTFRELKPFLIKRVWVDPKGYPRIHVDKSKKFSRKNISIVLNKETQEVIQEGNGLLAIPKEDDHQLYQWIDFYAVDSNSKVNLEERVESVRVDIKNSRFEGYGWNGYEVQLFLDYLEGEPKISPSQLKEFGTMVKQKSERQVWVAFGMAGSERVVVHLNNAYCSPEQKVTNKPQYDPTKEITWIEGFIQEEDGKERQIFSRRFYKGDAKLYPFDERQNISPDQANEELMKFLEAKD